MRVTKIYPAVLLLAGVLPAAFAQSGADGGSGHRPLYKVTIVSRTAKAVNYGHRSAPTSIGFTGTPLLNDARGKAVIEAKPGSTVIQASFSKVPPPTRFGPEYLTYVVWAISPDGRPENLGELTLNGSNKGKLTASTNLQTFALIVTAEPHFSVAQPSDVVVMENSVGPETVGKVEEVNATYELLPRKGYTYDPQLTSENATTGKAVSRSEYDLILAQYQAQNAIQMAEADGARQYAGERLARARQLYEQARGYPKSQRNDAIATARQATQVAEDARRIAVERGEADRTGKAHQQALNLNVQTAATETVHTEPLPEQGNRSRMEAPPPVADNRQAPVEVQVQPAPPPPLPPADPPPSPVASEDPQIRENRTRLVSTLQRSFDTVDSPRGIVVTLPFAITENGALPDAARRIASAVQPYPGVRLEVGAHSDREGEGELTQQAADSVRAVLASAGIPANAIVARGFGNANPRGPNTAGSGPAIQNRRIEVVINAEAVGKMANWDRTYAIETPRTAR